MIIRRHQRGQEMGFLDAKAVHRGTALDEAELLGEHFVANALSGEATLPDTLDTVSDEEDGGPYVESTAKVEFALDVDASNPRGSHPEAFPTAVHGPRAMRRG
jgi:hypothetical protein